MKKTSPDWFLVILACAVGLQAWYMFSRPLPSVLLAGRDHEKILLQGKVLNPREAQAPSLGEGYGQAPAGAVPGATPGVPGQHGTPGAVAGRHDPLLAQGTAQPGVPPPPGGDGNAGERRLIPPAPPSSEGPGSTGSDRQGASTPSASGTPSARPSAIPGMVQPPVALIPPPGRSQEARPGAANPNAPPSPVPGALQPPGSLIPPPGIPRTAKPGAQVPGKPAGAVPGKLQPPNTRIPRPGIPRTGKPGPPTQAERPPLLVTRDNAYHYWLAAIVTLEADGRHPLTPQQARTLLAFVRAIEAVTDENREALMKHMTPAQKAFVRQMVAQRHDRDEAPPTQQQMKAILAHVLEQIHVQE